VNFPRFFMNFHKIQFLFHFVNFPEFSGIFRELISGGFLSIAVAEVGKNHGPRQ